MARVSDHELNAFEVEEIWVQAGPKLVNVSTDGEVTVIDAPLHYRIRPRALRVVSPRGRFFANQTFHFETLRKAGYAVSRAAGPAIRFLGHPKRPIRERDKL